MTALAKVQDAWRFAAKKLGFDFIAPFQIEEDGSKLCYHGFVRGFGGPNGTLIFASERFEEDLGPLSRLAKKRGYFFSCLNAAVYRSYDEEVFIEVLTDWGWFGSSDASPPWLKKAPNQAPEPTAPSGRGSS